MVYTKNNKVNIFFPFSGKISGGGANFLELLKNDIKTSDLVYTDFIKSDIVLININPQNLTFRRVWFLLRKIKFLNKKIILFRVDGKLKDYRKKGYLYDWFIDKYLLRIPDEIIYQSYWSKCRYKNNFKNFKIIHNYIDTRTFTKKGDLKKSGNKKTKILFTSFSKNKDKGYEYLRYLDNNLDFEKYEITCVSPKGIMNFKNINNKGLLNQDQINQEFQKSDLYLFLSKNESCSNALLEALNTYIPILYLDSGSNSEIVGTKTNSFKTKEELLEKLSKKNLHATDKNKTKQNNNKSKQEYFCQLNKQYNRRKSIIKQFETFFILTFFLFFIPFKRI